MNNVDPSGHEFFSAQSSGSENWADMGGGGWGTPDFMSSGLPSSEWEKINQIKEKIYEDQVRAAEAAQAAVDNAVAALFALGDAVDSSTGEDETQQDPFADSVEAALKEVNSVVKAKVRSLINEELDGASLMNKAFSLGKPVIKLGDLATESGRNMQQGYMQIFAGVMIGIRNPKAHENISIDANRAIHFLVLASLLMHKLDEST